jgi:predicted ester cyclase
MSVAATGNPVTWSHIDIHHVQNGKSTDLWHNIPANDIMLQLGYELIPPSE